MGFNPIGAKAWRSINYGLTKAVDFIEFAKGVTNTAQIGCEALPCDFASIAVKSTCVLSVVAVKQLEVWSFHLAKLVRLNTNYQFIQVTCMKCIKHAHHHCSVCT